MSRTPLTALVAATALASPVLVDRASAVPVEQRRIATTHLRLALTAERSIEVELRLLTSAAGRELRVETARCDDQGCAERSIYAGPVTDAAVSASETHARLQVTVGGLPISLTWSPSDEPGRVLGGLRGSGDGGADDVSVYNGAPAVVSGRVGSVTCQLDGAVGDEVHVSDGSGPAAGVRPLSALRLPRHAATTC